MKKAATALGAIIIALVLCACGSFDKEYVSVSDYTLPAAESFEHEDKVTVANSSRLSSAISQLVRDGKTEGVIVFNDDYDGDVKADLASACWTVRTNDALCAYCVDNISYELSKIVTYYEAKIIITFAESAAPLDEIVQMSYSSGIENVILEALENNTQHLAVLIQFASFTADEMEQLVTDVYYENPLCSVKLPRVKVNLYRGSGMQRLYDLGISYAVDAETAQEKKQQLAELNFWGEMELGAMPDDARALAACDYLITNCQYTPDTSCNTAYSALLDGIASSEGLALAYVELCRQLDVKCTLVSGQKEWKTYYWNIICVDGEYYHVDVSACIQDCIENGFMLNDMSMWSEYRWDMGAYPRCDGSLSHYSTSANGV